MPQVSLYVDNETMAALRDRAALENSSLSKYVAKLVREDVDEGWPAGFWDLFGSVSDDTFLEPPELPFDLDARRAAF